MSRWDKLVEKIHLLSKDLRFDELRKAGCNPITVPKHEPIKRVYVEMVKQIIESEEKNDEDAK